MSDLRSRLLDTMNRRIMVDEMRSAAQSTALMTLTGAGFDTTEAGRDPGASTDIPTVVRGRRRVLHAHVGSAYL